MNRFLYCILFVSLSCAKDPSPSTEESQSIPADCEALTIAIGASATALSECELSDPCLALNGISDPDSRWQALSENFVFAMCGYGYAFNEASDNSHLLQLLGAYQALGCHADVYPGCPQWAGGSYGAACVAGVCLANAGTK